MKGGIAAAAFAALVGSATALNHRHAHAGLHKKNVAETCGCTTIYTYITGEPTLVPNPPPQTSSESSSSSAIVTPSSSSVAPEVPTTTSTPLPEPTTSEEVKVPVPTPEVTTCPTPGTYTIPATTVTVPETTTVCVPTSVHVVPGTHTVGGVTTVVVEATTVTCPVATVTTQPNGVVTSTIVQTEYVCPSAGTYTINPITTTVTEECDVEFPVPTSYNPGTYTAPEQVITVTETDFVYVCPYTSSGLPEPTKAPETPEAPKEEVTTKVETPKETKVETPKEQETETEEPTKETTSKSNTGHFDGSFGGSGDHYGITYTPYDESTGECKSASRVDSDIQEIKKNGFQVVRVYSTDCDTLPSVGDACKKHGLQMLIGLFVKETGCSPDTPEIKEQIDAISEWAQWDLVKLFIVGNESIMNGFCTPTELATLIKTVKSKCSGYTGPYTIAETLDQWLDPSTAAAICDEIDFTGANIHPFFNEANLATLAGKFVKGQLAILDKICKGKSAVNLECGWPNNGSRCNGEACPGKSQQADALKSIREECGDRTIFFSFGNDAWKEPGEYGCEQFWGAQDYFASL